MSRAAFPIGIGAQAGAPSADGANRWGLGGRRFPRRGASGLASRTLGGGPVFRCGREAAAMLTALNSPLGKRNRPLLLASPAQLASPSAKPSFWWCPVLDRLGHAQFWPSIRQPFPFLESSSELSLSISREIYPYPKPLL